MHEGEAMGWFDDQVGREVGVSGRTVLGDRLGLGL